MNSLTVALQLRQVFVLPRLAVVLKDFLKMDDRRFYSNKKLISVNGGPTVLFSTSFVTDLILCLGCVSLMLKLLFQLLLKDLQRLVLQVKLLHQGDLSQSAAELNRASCLDTESDLVIQMSESWSTGSPLTCPPGTEAVSLAPSFLTCGLSPAPAACVQTPSWPSWCLPGEAPPPSGRPADDTAKVLLVHFRPALLPSRVNLVVVLNLLISLSESRPLLFCLRDFCLCQTQFLLQGQCLEAV